MRYEIIFWCSDCQHINLSKLGLEGFFPINTRFETLTEAIDHITNNKHHQVYCNIEASNSRGADETRPT